MSTAFKLMPFDEINSADFSELQKDTKGFVLLSEYLKAEAGINLPPNGKNFSLMASRLAKVMSQKGFKKYSEYHKFLLSADKDSKREFISCLTTNTTQFYREANHFDFLRKWLPTLIKHKQAARSKEVRIWCAAASTGQEPYTILMELLEGLEGSNLDVKFLATDIDLEVLRKASIGAYSEKEIEGVPASLRQKYFSTIQGKKGTLYRVNKNISDMIRFAQLNLMHEYKFKHKFDIIFCRNVLIYFDQHTATDVVDRLSREMSDTGLLFLGHSESGTMRMNHLSALAHAIYMRKGQKGK